MRTSTGWDTLTTSVKHSASASGGHCSPRAHGLILTETDKFLALAPPTSEDELRVRYLQSSSLTSIKVGGIIHGDNMVRQHPRIADKVFAEVARLCDLPLPTSEEELLAQYQVSSDVTSRIAQICWSDR
jgi:hypothetical protein